jgi:hypothetical protein
MELVPDRAVEPSHPDQAEHDREVANAPPVDVVGQVMRRLPDGDDVHQVVEQLEEAHLAGVFDLPVLSWRCREPAPQPVTTRSVATLRPSGGPLTPCLPEPDHAAAVSSGPKALSCPHESDTLQTGAVAPDRSTRSGIRRSGRFADGSDGHVAGVGLQRRTVDGAVADAC